MKDPKDKPPVPPPLPVAEIVAPCPPPRPQSMEDTARGRLYLQRFKPDHY